MTESTHDPLRFRVTMIAGQQAAYGLGPTASDASKEAIKQCKKAGIRGKDVHMRVTEEWTGKTWEEVAQ